MAIINRPVELATLRPVLDALHGAPGVFVGVDFDGTLAPIVERPERAVLAPGVRDALARLHRCPRARVAVISGRRLDDVRDRVGLEGIVYAGNHGFEIEVDGERYVHPQFDAFRPTLAAVAQRLRLALDGVSGARVEDKGATLTVHNRQASLDAHATIDSTVEGIAASAECPLELRRGKRSLELRPPVAWDKGRSVERIRAALPASWRTIYVGDDTTDEDVFANLTLPDLAIGVGCRDRSEAVFALHDQTQVVPLLVTVARWAEAIDGGGARSG